MARFFNLTDVRSTCFCVLALCLTMGWSACQENGDIGDLYGQWKLISRSEGSEHEPLAEGYGYYLSFQGKVVWAKVSYDEAHSYTDVFGNFQHEGNQLRMQFYQVVSGNSPEAIVSGRFGFEHPEDIRLEICTLDGDRLILSDGQRQWSFEHY